MTSDVVELVSVLSGNVVFEEIEAGRLLGDALAEMTEIRHLTLRQCRLTDVSLQHVVNGICRGPGCQKLETLDFTVNKLTSEGGSEDTTRNILTQRRHLRIEAVHCGLSEQSERRLEKKFPGRFHLR
ncbi:hypothetical protein LSAT2_003906 [Lamellibrachia satsuma]|nr:hypothetical protein LSAT2_003906 [Lamellibrachia satsuma]